MKKFLYLSMIMTLVSCTKEQLADNIVGEWQLSSLTISACPDESNNVPLIEADSDGCLTANGIDVCQTVTFFSDGTAMNVSSTDNVIMSQQLTYTVNEDNDTVTSIDENNNANVFSVSGNIITVISDFGDCTLTSQLEKQ